MADLFSDLDSIPFCDLTLGDLKRLGLNTTSSKNPDHYQDEDYYYRKMVSGEFLDNNDGIPYYESNLPDYTREMEYEKLETVEAEEGELQEEYDLTKLNFIDCFDLSKNDNLRRKLKMGEVEFQTAWFNGLFYKKGESILYKKNSRMHKAFEAGRRASSHV